MLSLTFTLRKTQGVKQRIGPCQLNGRYGAYDWTRIVRVDFSGRAFTDSNVILSVPPAFAKFRAQRTFQPVTRRQLIYRMHLSLRLQS